MYQELKNFKLSPEERRITAEIQRRYRNERKQKKLATKGDPAKNQPSIADESLRETP